MAKEAKYKRLLNEAFEQNREMFQVFMVLNADYADREKRAGVVDEFNEIGERVKEVLLDCEEELCCFAEADGHSTSKLSEKFWNEVRKYFPYIDSVGVVVKSID